MTVFVSSRAHWEYCAMFNLGAEELTWAILDSCAGAASFVAEQVMLGHRAVGVDPIYRLEYNEVRRLTMAGVEEARRNVVTDSDGYTWGPTFANLDEHYMTRTVSARRFLRHYRSRSLTASCYVAGSASALPIHDNAVDLAVSSHFLFTHAAAIGGLMRTFSY